MPKSFYESSINSFFIVSFVVTLSTCFMVNYVFGYNIIIVVLAISAYVPYLLIRLIRKVLPKQLNGFFKKIQNAYEEVYATILIIFYHIMAIFKEQPKPPSKPTILIIHGYLGITGSVKPIKEALIANGYDANQIQILGHDFMPQKRIEERAEEVKSKIESIYDQTLEPIILIGHSMGGLISAVIAHNNPKIKKIITIASPIQGTLKAHIAPGCGQQMIPNSPFVREWANKIAEDPRYFHIGATSDNAVSIDSALNYSNDQYIGTPIERTYEISDIDNELSIGHQSILLTESTITPLINFLQKNTSTD